MSRHACPSERSSRTRTASPEDSSARISLVARTFPLSPGGTSMNSTARSPALFVARGSSGVYATSNG